MKLDIPTLDDVFGPMDKEIAEKKVFTEGKIKRLLPRYGVYNRVNTYDTANCFYKPNLGAAVGALPTPRQRKDMVAVAGGIFVSDNKVYLVQVRIQRLQKVKKEEKTLKKDTQKT